jgi:aldose 1-epimerase
MQEISPPSGAQWTIRSGEHEAVVVEVGGGLRAYRVAGREIFDGYAEDEVAPGTAGHVLAPWPNRVRDGRYPFGGHTYQLDLSEPAQHNAIHGLVRWAPWRLLDTPEPDQLTVEYVQPAVPGYPWTLRVTTTWQVGPDGLRASHTATNLAGTPAPFGLGVHPYLKVPGATVDDVVLTVPARNRLLLDGRKLPIGAARVAGGDYDFTSPRRIGPAVLDTAFGEVIHADGGGSAVVLSTVDGASTVTVWADAAFGWWQVFTGDTLAPPRTRRSVAVEPMTCPPDAFHSGRDLITLEPGQTWQGSWGVSTSISTSASASASSTAESTASASPAASAG